MNQTIAPFELKATNTRARTFEGLGSTWSLDNGGDVIEPGAFTDTLSEWKASGLSLPLIDQHDYSSVIRSRLGKMVDAYETAEGLWAKFKVFNTRAGLDLLAMLEEEGVDGLSIGYGVRDTRPVTDVERKAGVRRVLTRVHLGEISVVHWGMNPEALIRSGSIKRGRHPARLLEPVTYEETHQTASSRENELREIQLRGLKILASRY